MSQTNPFARLFKTYAFTLGSLEPSSSPGDPVKITLRNDVRTDQEYEVISYDRSADFGSMKILLGDKSIDVPKPLGNALRVLRKSDSPRLLWADVLLGKTARERNAQAIVAKGILQNASRTIAWLGSGGARTPMSFDVLTTMANWWHQAVAQYNLPANFAQYSFQQMVQATDSIKSRDVTLLHTSDDEVWDGIMAVYASTYFSSVQMIPDVVLSKNVVVTCGSNTIAWGDLYVAFSCAAVVLGQMLEGKSFPDAAKKTFTNMGAAEIARRRYIEDPGLELLPMVQSARGMQYSDDREIVFSMLPIVRYSKRTSSHKIMPPMPAADYSKSKEEVFQEASSFIIQERQDFFVWWLERPPHARKTKEMPSWVPDWSTPLPDSVLKMAPNNGLRNWTESVASRKPINVENGVLHCQGHFLGKVVFVTPIFTFENYRKELLKAWQFVYNEPGMTTEVKKERFWRTMLLNRGGQGDSIKNPVPPPKEYDYSLTSLVAEERLIELLHCTREEFLSNPQLQAQARADPTMTMIGQACGYSEPFEELFKVNGIGRRFFLLDTGYFGMSAYEEMVDDSPPEHLNFLENMERTQERDAHRSDPFSHAMLEGFRDYLAQRDSRAVSVVETMMNHTYQIRGVRQNDHVVALVGGFQPYILRELGEDYVYVGDSYVHGVMDGECFTTNTLFGQQFRQDVEVKDIHIV